MQVGMFKWLYNILSLLEKQEQSGGLVKQVYIHIRHLQM
jgi:hypothetical protein